MIRQDETDTRAPLDLDPAACASRRSLAVLCLAVFALYSTYAWVRHLRFVTTGFDLGIFDQAVRAYARFQAPIVSLKAPGYDLLGDHFHPIIALWAPLYWIWADPRMLLLAQAALVSSSIVPVVRFAARRVGERRALVVGLVYGLSWPLQRMIQFDVHEIAFAVPLIAVVIDALDRRAHRVTIAACAVLLLVREDMGAFVVLAGLLVVVLGPGDSGGGRATGVRAAVLRRRATGLLGAGVAVLGVLGYELATAVVIPHFSGGAGFVYWTFPALGPDPASAVRFAVTHPWSVLHLLVTPWVKEHTLLMLGLPTLYLCLFSPFIVLVLPFIAQRLLNSRELLWTTNFHYSAVLAPIMFMAAVDTVARLRRRWAIDAWLVWCVGVLVIAMAAQAGDYPVSRIWTARFWARDARVLAIEATLPLIPDHVCVEAENTVAPQLTGRDYVTRIDRSDDLATWMVLDFSRDDTGWEGPTPAAAYDQALTRGFEVVSQRGVIVLLSRPGVAVQPICRG